MNSLGTSLTNTQLFLAAHCVDILGFYTELPPMDR